MVIQLRDIIDLDFLLSLDEQEDSGQAKESIAARDRDIFIHLDQPGQDDASLMLSWLEFRKLVFFHGTDKGTGEAPGARLPGTLFASLYGWLVWGLLGAGLFSGMSMAYSFLAYHGARPINVTLFFTVFILFQVLLFGLTLILLVRRWIMSRTGNTGNRASIVHTLISSFFLKGLAMGLNKLTRVMKGNNLEIKAYNASLIRMKSREYASILFWPFFVLSSFFAAAFSAGALGATLFRVAVYDMAFGWQSTLVTASTRIHEALALISLPWSWFVPESLAHPSLDQIEGSRLLLKEGISFLSTQDLVSWWPFLCLGIFFYGVLPRILLILAGCLAQKRALEEFDFEKPRFKRLKVRMQSPIMDVQFMEEPVSQAREELPVPDFSDPAGFDSETDRARPSRSQGGTALVLASPSVYTQEVLARVSKGISRQLFFEAGSFAPVSHDFDQDKDQMISLAQNSPDQVVALQEVWQPPIRGLLHYYVQLKTQVFIHQTLWILLTQAPGEETLSVDREDIQFKVWKKAVQGLGQPDIMLERLEK